MRGVRWFRNLLAELAGIRKELRMSTAALDRITAAVANQTTVDESILALVSSLKTELDAAIAATPTDDSSALDALSEQLEAQQAALSDAVTANTPAA